MWETVSPRWGGSTVPIRLCQKPELPRTRNGSETKQGRTPWSQSTGVLHGNQQSPRLRLLRVTYCRCLCKASVSSSPDHHLVPEVQSVARTCPENPPEPCPPKLCKLFEEERAKHRLGCARVPGPLPGRCASLGAGDWEGGVLVASSLPARITPCHTGFTRTWGGRCTACFCG